MVNLLIILITVDVLVGVFFRYILGSALSWSEELAGYMMVWMGFLAAGLVLREENHMNFKILQDRLPLVPRKILVLACDSLVLVFLAAFFVLSWEALQIIKNDISSSLDIKMLWPFLAMPVSAVLMMFQQVMLIHTHIAISGDGRPSECAP
jgi:TRAP-type C4-dicarboxylate transport system permease small subunit